MAYEAAPAPVMAFAELFSILLHPRAEPEHWREKWRALAGG